jgi:hypothetical protein
MAELDQTRIANTSINTPAAGVTASFIDSTSKQLLRKHDDGSIDGLLSNQSVSTPGAGFASDTYLVGSSITVPNGFFRVGTRYRLRFDVVKTAAGTATPIFSVRIGTAGTTGDTAVLTFTFAAGTAAIDTGIVEIEVLFRTVGSGTSAVVVGWARIMHHLAATGITSTGAAGIAIIPAVVSSGFNSTVASSIIGVSVNGGTSAAWTISQVEAELINQ